MQPEPRLTTASHPPDPPHQPEAKRKESGTYRRVSHSISSFKDRKQEELIRKNTNLSGGKDGLIQEEIFLPGGVQSSLSGSAHLSSSTSGSESSKDNLPCTRLYQGAVQGAEGAPIEENN